MPGQGYKPLTKDDLRDRIKELDQRIKQMDRRDRALGDLRKWLAHRKLDALDLLWMYRQMKPQRAAKAVTSKNAPLGKRVKEHDQYTERGKVYPSKGDPAFRKAMREARVKMQLSAMELGKKIGISNATISSWEKGRYIPSEKNRLKIVKALNLPASAGAKATREMEKAMSTRAIERANGLAAPG